MLAEPKIEAPVSLPPAKAFSERHSVKALHHLARDPIGVVGLIIVLLVIGGAIFAPLLAPYPPNKIHIEDVLQTPNRQYLLGTDELGRDMLSRIIYGARVSLRVSIGTVLLAVPIGVAIGLAAGYSGGKTDNVISRLLDIAFAFPAILLALLIIAVLGSDLNNVIIALAIVYTPRFARITRGSVLVANTEQYVEAARSYGCTDLRIMTHHILPNIMSPIIVQTTVTLAVAVLAEASLSFLGLGNQPPDPAWGSMLSSGRIYMEQYAHLTIFPGLAIAITVMAFNLLGDGLRDALDPKLRLHH